MTKKQIVKDVISILVIVIIEVMILYTIREFADNFGYTTELGFYDTRCYSFNVGEYLAGKPVTYTHTRLNLLEILKRIY